MTSAPNLLRYKATMSSLQRTCLMGVKLLHSAVWLFFAGCVAAIPIVCARGEFPPSAVLSGLVMTECAVLAVNRGRCPLADPAGRYTKDRQANFDIYLPLRLARPLRRPLRRFSSPENYSSSGSG
jgi:hypothetical protein